MSLLKHSSVKALWFADERSSPDSPGVERPCATIHDPHSQYQLKVQTRLKEKHDPHSYISVGSFSYLCHHRPNVVLNCSLHSPNGFCQHFYKGHIMSFSGFLWSQHQGKKPCSIFNSHFYVWVCMCVSVCFIRHYWYKQTHKCRFESNAHSVQI